MKRPAFLLALAVLSIPHAARADDPVIPIPLPTPVPAPQEREPSHPRNRFVADPITDFGMLSVAVGFSGLLEWIIGTGELTPQLPTSKDRLLSIDRSAVHANYSKSAPMLSNIGIGAAAAYSIIGPILTAYEYDGQAGLVDGIIFAESMAFTWSATNLAKIAVRRPRPLAYQRKIEFDAAQAARPLNEPRETFSIDETDTALSFFSGHSSITATIAATATYLEFARHPKSVRPWLTLIVGTALTTFVAYERVAAGKHFPTDVIAGAMAGAGIGVIVPHLHREDTLKQRPVWIGGSFNDGGGTLSFNGLF